MNHYDNSRDQNRIPAGYTHRGGRKATPEYHAYDAPNPTYRPVRVKGTTVSTPRNLGGPYVIWDADPKSPTAGTFIRSDVSVGLSAME